MIWIHASMGTLRLDADELRMIRTISHRSQSGSKEQYYIVLELKSGELFLVSTGQDDLRNAEMERQFMAAFRAAAISTEPEPNIDLFQIMQESGDPPYCAVILISGRKAEGLLRLAEGGCNHEAYESLR